MFFKFLLFNVCKRFALLVFQIVCILDVSWNVFPQYSVQKIKFALRISSVNETNPQFLTDLVTFTEKKLNGTLPFLCSLCFIVCYLD